MDKKSVKKLVLKKETVRELTPHELNQAAGGMHYPWDHNTKACSWCDDDYTCTCAVSIDVC